MSFSRILQAFALLVPLAAAQACVVESLPNPLAGQTGYPDTGTVNGTASRILERQQFMCLTYESPQVAILPIPYKLARSIIPSQYPILKKQYQQWLPWLPKDQYPVRHCGMRSYVLYAWILTIARPCSRQNSIMISEEPADPVVPFPTFLYVLPAKDMSPSIHDD